MTSMLSIGRDLRVTPHPLGDAMPKRGLRIYWHAAHHTDPGDRWLRDLVAATVELPPARDVKQPR